MRKTNKVRNREKKKINRIGTGMMNKKIKMMKMERKIIKEKMIIIMIEM